MWIERPRPRARPHACPHMGARGVTLIELVLFMAIVAIALGGIIAVMNLTSQHSADPLRRKQALIIAEGLLEEIELARFSYCDPSDPDADKAESSAACLTAPEAWGQGGAEPVNARPYDNVNDYVPAAATPTTAFNDGTGKVLLDANGNALGVSGYSAKVSITPAALGPSGAVIGTSGGTGSSADTEVLRITVQVDFDGQSLVLEGYRTRYAPNSL